jgi:hypothetical protein
MFLNYFNVMMYFKIKNILKDNYYHNFNQNIYIYIYFLGENRGIKPQGCIDC